MILCSLDFETTGLDRDKDRITEVGCVLWTTTFNRVLEVQSFFVDAGLPIPAETIDLTGISQGMVSKFGVPEEYAVDEIVRMATVADAYIGQNIKGFDKEFFLNAAKRCGKVAPEKLWIDTCVDLPGVKKEKLSLMAAEAVDPKTGRHCGFVNPFPHSALSDAMTVLQLVSLHDIDAVVFRAKQPELVIRSHQVFDNNHQAKKLGFVFKSDLGKRWLKVVKQCDLAELEKAPFDISIEDDLTPQQVWYS